MICATFIRNGAIDSPSFLRRTDEKIPASKPQIRRKQTNAREPKPKEAAAWRIEFAQADLELVSA